MFETIRAGGAAVEPFPVDDCDEYAALSRRDRRMVQRAWAAVEAPQRAVEAEDRAAAQALELVDVWGHFGTVDDLDADAVLDRASAVRRSVNLAEAETLVLAAHWADLHSELPFAAVKIRGNEQLVRPGGVGTPQVAEFCRADLGAALGISVTAAGKLIGDALDLRHRLPRLWAAVRAGSVKVWMARKIAVRTRPLSVDAARKVDASTAGLAATLPYPRLEAVVEAAILRADPAQAKTDVEAAIAGQGVWAGRDTRNGIRSIFGRAAAPDVHAADGCLDQLAWAMTVLGDTDPYDLRRAKALGVMANPTAALDLIRLADQALATEASEEGANCHRAAGPHDGTDPRRGCDLGPATLYVHVTQQAFDEALDGDGDGDGFGVARVEGVGPVLLEQVRGWLGHRQVTVKPVVDLPGMPAVDRYEVPPTMAEAVKLRTPADCFPFSPNTSGKMDKDHTKRFVPMADGGPTGQTRLDNLGGMIRGNHRIKTFGRWKVTQPRSGIWIWRDPHGNQYLVDHAGTTPLGKLR